MSRHLITWLTLALAAAGARADQGPGTTPAPVPAKTEAEALPLPRPAEKMEPLKQPAEKTDPPKQADSLARALAQLRRERLELTTERTAALKDIEASGQGDGEELARLRLRLRELVARLAVERNRKQQEKPSPSSQRSQLTKPEGGNPTEATEPESETAGNPRSPANGGPKPEGTGTIDPAGLAQAFFRSEDFAGALRAYRIIDQRKLKLEDRITIVYMMATCLRRTGKLSEAAALYRKVADSRGNPIMADCARWQLGAIRWRQDLEARLVDIRKERTALEVKK